MFWQFLIAAGLAIALIQLGAQAVWVSVLSFALKAVFLAAVSIALCKGLPVLWQRYKELRRRASL